MIPEPFISFDPTPDSLHLTDCPIIVDKGDYKGVHIAASNLAKDLEAVTGSKSHVLQHDPDVETPVVAETAIIVGTLQSLLIQAVIKHSDISVGDVIGQWESFVITIRHDPLSGCKRALVVIGSDSRGAIYGVYTLSEHIGVSPWYWWADVTPLHHAHIYALPTRIRHGPPSVKYRGIFINDEAPALTGWVLEKFGKYGLEFYERVFELLLRLKANFLWPAMWPGYPNPGSAFFTDDSRNQAAAHDWGIVVSTSHHEPMQRAMVEWFSNAENGEGSWSWTRNTEKIQTFMREGVERAKPYESYVTLGMRGDGDRAMDVGDPMAVLRKILEFQRQTIREVYGSENGPMQLLALYKEVQEYFDTGLYVPEDITLLFADDNFGTLRRLPTESERQRPGRTGIYYHLEYVGEPRSYKWINSNSCGKIWHQLCQAYESGADQIWVFNVGDIKPLELPITFAMKMAWDVDSISPGDFRGLYNDFAARNITSVSRTLIEEIGGLLYEYDRLVALRKHEHIEADTFSILNYREADQVVERWQRLADMAENYSESVEPERQDAYFQLIAYPFRASYIYVKLRVCQAQNHLWALQRRNAANQKFHEVLELFNADHGLSLEFHRVRGGKWNQIMRQPHYGYRDTWHAPSRDMIGGLCYVQTAQDSNPIVGQMGIAVEGHPGVRPGLTNEESDRTHPSRKDLVPGLTLPVWSPWSSLNRYIDIYRRGTKQFSWKVSTPPSEMHYPWLRAKPNSGNCDEHHETQRVELEVDWSVVPLGFDETVTIEVTSTAGDYEQIHVPLLKPIIPPEFAGFVEAERCISIDAPLFSRPRKNDYDAGQYRILPFLGRTFWGAVGVSPAYQAANEDLHDFLEYDIFTLSHIKGPVWLNLQFTLTLDANPHEALHFEVAVDERSLGKFRLIERPGRPGELPNGWLEAVQDGVWQIRIDVSKSDGFTAGSHTVKVRFWQQNVILEKLVIDLGGMRESYLGPSASVTQITHIET